MVNIEAWFCIMSYIFMMVAIYRLCKQDRYPMAIGVWSFVVLVSWAFGFLLFLYVRKDRLKLIQEVQNQK